MSNIVPARSTGVARRESRYSGRALARIDSQTELGLAEIESQAELQAARVMAVGYVGKRAMHEVAMISQLEQQLATLVPDGDELGSRPSATWLPWRQPTWWPTPSGGSADDRPDHRAGAARSCGRPPCGSRLAGGLLEVGTSGPRGPGSMPTVRRAEHRLHSMARNAFGTMLEVARQRARSWRFDPSMSWRSKAVEALALTIAIAVVARVVWGLLGPLLPALLVMVAVSVRLLLRGHPWSPCPPLITALNRTFPHISLLTRVNGCEISEIGARSNRYDCLTSRPDSP